MTAMQHAGNNHNYFFLEFVYSKFKYKWYCNENSVTISHLSVPIKRRYQPTI